MRQERTRTVEICACKHPVKNHARHEGICYTVGCDCVHTYNIRTVIYGKKRTK